MDYSNLIGWDTETHPTRNGLLCPPLVSVQMAGVGEYPGPTPNGRTTIVRPMANGWASVHTQDDARVVAASILAPSRVGGPFVAFRAAYDIAVSAAANGMLPDALKALPHTGTPGHLRCAFVAETLIRVATGEAQREDQDRRKFSLASLVNEYLHIDLEGKCGPDKYALHFAELEHVPLDRWPTGALEYCLMDGVTVRDVYIAQQQRAEKMWFAAVNGCLGNGNYIRNETEQTRASFDLHLAACEGLRLDPGRGLSTVAAWESKAADGTVAGREAGFIRPDGTRDLKAQRALIEQAYTSTGRRPPMTPGGQKPNKKGVIAPPAVATGAEVLKESGHPLLERYAKASEYINHLSKYRDLLSAGAQRVTYKVTPCMATGRVSVAEPPFQQPPKEGGFRECWTAPRAHLSWDPDVPAAPSDNVLVSIDYNQIELVALAWVCREKGFGTAMADAINQGTDLHYLMAFGLLNAAGTSDPDGNRWTLPTALQVTTKGSTELAQARSMGKVANFGLGGGMGPSSFVGHAKGYDLVITEAQARTIIQVYRETFPEMVQYFAWVSSLTAHAAADVAQFVSGRVRGDLRYTQACNTFFQGLAADGMKRALAAVTDAIHDPNSPAFGARVVLTLHDELILSVPRDRLNPAADVIAGIVRAKMGEVIPGMRIKAEPAAMEYWSKEADTVRDAAGNLLVWGPK